MPTPARTSHCWSSLSQCYLPSHIYRCSRDIQVLVLHTNTFSSYSITRTHTHTNTRFMHMHFHMHSWDKTGEHIRLLLKILLLELLANTKSLYVCTTDSHSVNTHTGSRCTNYRRMVFSLIKYSRELERLADAIALPVARWLEKKTLTD